MNNKRILILVLIFLMFSVAGCGKLNEDTTDGDYGSVSSESFERTEFMLGTIITISLYDHKKEAIMDLAFDKITEIENRMSINIKDSDISKVNRNAGIKEVQVHPDVYYVLKRAKYYAELTDGAFDPTIGPLVKLWGIGTENAHIPKEEELAKAVSKINYKKMELLEDYKVFLKEKGMIIDLGGIAKGYAADEVNKILSENGVKSAVIDLGGNVFVKGRKYDGNKWRIGIQNPFDVREEHVGIVSGASKTVVTSGNYERYFEKNGIRYHHILDRETGYPANNEVAGISIIADKSIDADALSTSLYILGVEKGLALAEDLENVEAIFIDKDKNVYVTSGLKGTFNPSNDEYKITNP